MKLTSQKLLLATAGTVAAMVAMSAFVHPFGDPRQVVPGGGQILAGAEIPTTIREIVERKCVNCHSEAVEWPIYSRIAPVSWLLEHDVTEARAHMNLSRWASYGGDEKLSLLTKLGAEVRSGEMPPGRYTIIHRDAALTQSEQDVLYEWTKKERNRLKTVTSTSVPSDASSPGTDQE